ncbi:KTSC domain-containing protein [Thermocoleostomius sinensis]|jgi:hypothetical protein|uniref:KTSC domain-containing protein n=1 Tax=Thermocoleostomius sinensis A174 TaxID=2016057 RepID=A0A9E9C440_9CYAN|nr:KTSC domain-containing protein [Thermocoleostomius sinensis]WAL59626.1 KTSC domain-containing protein [Thermocoleostomius sinensis A174]
MQLQPVNSDQIYAIGYDAAIERLVVVFQNHRIYQFFDVPATVYHELLRAGSKDQYIQTSVVGQYPYAQLLRRKRKRHR